MNLTGEQSTPFEIPELCYLIASHLGPHDFSQLCLVSKKFSQLFLPFLWKKIQLQGCLGSRDKRLPWTQALKSNGHLVKHAELFSWNRDESREGDSDDSDEGEEGHKCLRTVIEDDSSEEDVQRMDAVLENDDHVLARTLLAQCGSNLTSLKVVDHSFEGRILGAVLERIHGNRTLEGAQLLDGIQVLDITLTYNAYDTQFRTLLYTRTHKDPQVAAVFSGVTELRLQTSNIQKPEPWVREEPIEFLFCNVVEHFPNLLRLSLNHVYVMEPAEDFEPAVTTNPMPPSDYHFRALDFQESWISAQQIIQVLERSPRVQSIKIGPNIRWCYAEDLVTSLPALTPNLTEYGQNGITLSGLSTMFRGLQHLTTVRLTCVYVKDNELQVLAESCPLLSELYLHECELLTSCGLKHILRSSKHLRTLDVPSTEISWDLFEQDSAKPLKTDGSTGTTTMMSTPPAAFIPWACQDTLQKLNINMDSFDGNSKLADSARQRLQSFTQLWSLELWCDDLPAAALLDPLHKDDFSSDQPAVLYPELEILKAHFITPGMKLIDTMKLVRSMPKLRKGICKPSFDILSVKWFNDRVARTSSGQYTNS